ncbi:MAG: carboxypeptidase regulatory-like domain-containing protein [Bryobacteraceae bacterium]
MTRTVLLFLCACCLALAQVSTSEITGTVHDSTGAVVPGANVTATNEATGVTYRQTTTNTGLYAFPAMPVGSYTITADITGFKTVKRTGNQLVVGTPLTVDFALEVGQAAEVVNVEATAVAVQTENAAIGNVVSEKAIKDLPLNGRNPLNLLVLEPGVVQRSAGGVGSGISVNGSRDRAFNVTIDGIEANESTVPNPLANLYRLTPDNIQEYKVTTSNPTAEEGRNSGANINVATRSGQNAFHGTLFEFFRNTDLNSSEFFSNAQGTPKKIIKMNQYGAQFSGPIVRNKTFFFFSWSDQKINFSQPIDQAFGSFPAIYTPTARAGIYRYFVTDPKNPFVINGQTITKNSPLLVDPHTGALAPGVRNCASPSDVRCVASYNFAANDPKGIGVDPTIAKLFASYPLPNNYSSAGDGLNTATYLWNPPTQFRGPNFMYRVDHNFNENNNLFVRWLQGSYNTLQGDPLNGRPQVFPGFPPEGEVFRTTKNLAISYRHVFSPRVVNELTTGFSRFIFLFTQGEANPAYPNAPPYAFANASLPYINTPRTFRAVTTPQLIDNLSIVKSSHIFRLGANIRLYEHNDQRGQPGGINVTPSLQFSATTRPPAGFTTPSLASSSAAGINSTDNTRLLGAINDVLGIPSRLGQVFLGDLTSNGYLPFLSGNAVTLWDEGVRIKQYDFYFQDEWRATRNLVINYGARWEINLAPSESGGRVYVPSSPIVGSSNVSFVHADRWYQNNSLNAIGPRLGIAWAPGGSQKTVFRAGWGISFDPLGSFEVTAAAGKVPGLTLQCNSVPGGSTTPGCQSVPDVRIAQGFPVQLAPPTTKPGSFLAPPVQLLTSAPSLTVFDQNFKLPTVHEWNFNIQRELPGGFVAQAGYIGKRGLRLQRAYDVNQINAEPILPSFLIMQQNVAAKCNPDGSGCPGGVGKPVPIVTQGIVNSAFVNSSTTLTDISQNGAGNFAGRIEQTTLAAHLRPNQQFSTITYLDSGGDSYYHSFQLTVRKRFSAGLLFGLAYTYSKSIDDQSVDPVGASSGGGLSTTTSRAPADIRTWRNERALSDFDRPHVVTTNFVYDFPFGKGQRFLGSAPGVVSQTIGGWSLNGLYTHMSGEPFSVTSGIRTANFSHVSRADIAGATPPPVHYHDTAGVAGPVVFDSVNSFAIPAPGADGAGRNIFRAAAYWNLDLSLIKRFSITERVRLQFRAEAFNVLNHPNFDNPVSASVGSPSIQSSVFAQTCCATVAPPSTQSIVQTGESARVIQLGLKLDF